MSTLRKYQDELELYNQRISEAFNIQAEVVNATAKAGTASHESAVAYPKVNQPPITIANAIDVRLVTKDLGAGCISIFMRIKHVDREPTLIHITNDMVETMADDGSVRLPCLSMDLDGTMARRAELRKLVEEAEAGQTE